MTLFDLLIIYLACGAPFGVYYFLHNRKRSFSRQTWLKTILAFLFWIPFSYRLLRNGKIKRKLFDFKSAASGGSDSEQEKQLFSLKRQIEKFSLENRSPISIYEVREVFDRYSGLTIAHKNPNSTINEHAAELFRIAKRENVKLGAICLERRNQKRLVFHQSQARKDFLNLIESLAKANAQTDRLKELSVKFVKVLNDEPMISEIEKLFASALQTEKKTSVKKLEKDLWKAETHKPQPAQQISISLHSLRARANSLSKD